MLLFEETVFLYFYKDTDMKAYHNIQIISALGKQEE